MKFKNKEKIIFADRNQDSAQFVRLMIKKSSNHLCVFAVLVICILTWVSFTRGYLHRGEESKKCTLKFYALVCMHIKCQ